MSQSFLHRQDQQTVTRDSTHPAKGNGMSLPAVPVSAQFKVESPDLTQLKEEEIVPAQPKPFQLKEGAQPESLQSPNEKPIQEKPFQLRVNNTGLPDALKSGVESLSGFDMSDVKVHYNSAKPAQLQALAYAQGSNIHIGPGQEQHLPHEAWHVVQQKQGRVQPTLQMKDGVAINDDKGLEQEADTMGAQAFQLKAEACSTLQSGVAGQVVQRTTVKVGTSPKDLADFESAQPVLMGYLGGPAPVPIASAALAGEGRKTTNIWAHMSDDEVGGMSHEDLAALLIAKGWRSSGEIRMIGCNVQGEASVTGPTKLWHALFDQLSAIILEGHTPDVPTIYATKGPLHTGGSTLAPGQNFYVVEENDRSIDVDQIYMREFDEYEEAKAVQMGKWAEKDRTKARKKILKKYAGEVATTAEEAVLTKYNDEIEAIVNEDAERNDTYYDQTNSPALNRIKAEHQARVSAGYDESQRTTNKYPSIFARNEQNTAWVWNDAAWVSYSGPEED